MARKTYASDVEAYLDAELAAANDDRSRAGSSGRQQVSESASRYILAMWGRTFPHEFRFYPGSALLALLPALVIVARAGLGALPQREITTGGWLPWAMQGITGTAAVWAVLVTLWQARNTWRRARGRAASTLPFRQRQNNREGPGLDIVAIRLGVAVATLPALLWLALSGRSEPLWLLGALVALPPVFLVAAVGLDSLTHALSARGAVDETMLEPLPASSPQVAQLDARIAQLQQIRVWLKDDKLKSMIDDVIGKQVARSERRQVTYAVAVGAVSLLAGWLLSAISPVSALAPLLQR